MDRWMDDGRMDVLQTTGPQPVIGAVFGPRSGLRGWMEVVKVNHHLQVCWRCPSSAAASPAADVFWRRPRALEATAVWWRSSTSWTDKHTTIRRLNLGGLT